MFKNVAEASVSQMRIFIGITDRNWFTLHASRSNVDEVNFWRPSPNAALKVLDSGELFLFKLLSFVDCLNQILPLELIWALR